MQNLFRLEHETFSGSIDLRQWEYAKSGLLRNVEKIETFYQDFPVGIPSSHLLVKLIQSMNISRNLSYERYLANCSARALIAAQSVKMTSGLSKGQMFDGVFYGSGSKEIIIGHDTYFQIEEARMNWKNLQPVTVLMHNQSNTNLMLPDGKISSSDKGVSVIAVNIPMLMAMYYCFNAEQDIAEKTGAARRTVMQFVCSYALAGMTRSHLDNVILNRLYNHQIGVPDTLGIRKHSFFLNDYDTALDTAADMQTKYLVNMNRRFSSLMKATYLPCAGNLWEFSHLPSVPYTLQVFWALVVSRLKILAFLCQVSEDYEVTSRREINTIRWLMEIHQTTRVIKANLGLEAYFDIAPYLDAAKID